MQFVRIRLLCVVITVLVPLVAFGEEQSKSPAELIERDVEGWKVILDPQLLEEQHRDMCDKALEALANHLQRVKYIVPEDRLAKLKQLPIWLDRDYKKLGSMQYHPSREWLVDNGHDARLAKHVHIPQAADLYSPSTWAKHPYVVLHELAHAYHDQVLSFEHPGVIKVFDEAKEKKLYEEVLLYTGQKVKHYGLTNHKEYFAETTEAYFGVNDFYPFVRAELKEHDPSGFALMEAVWGKIK